MEIQEFWERVTVRSGLPSKEQAKAATDAVFDALRARISHQTGDNIAQQFPTELKELWESGLAEHIERALVDVERMDLDEFLQKIQHDPRVGDAAPARDVARAVFMTVQEQITPGAVEKIAGELPPDIRGFWLDSAPPAEAEAVEEGEYVEEMEEEVPLIGPEYDIPTGADMEPTPSLPSTLRQGSPEGEYDSREIGPSAASVFRSDDQLAEEINELLEANDELDASNIDVYVHQGRVTLKGSVHSPTERDEAAMVAGEALGTVEVINEIKVAGD